MHTYELDACQIHLSSSFKSLQCAIAKAVEMCMGMRNAGFPFPRGIPMRMETKLRKLIGMGQKWAGISSDGNGNAYY